MTIVLTGGGSGGHITPILAVAAELKNKDPKARIIYIGQTGDSLADIPREDPNLDEIYTIRAGKFRRFYGEGLGQFLNVSVFLKNFRDFFYVLIGIFQSWKLLNTLKPDVIFSRGGYVSVPVALAAALHKIPYITHDSDSIPSLANRIIARWAKLHAVALPKNIYPYPQDKTITTGIPVSENFKKVTSIAKNKYREQLNIPVSTKVLFIIGGGLGSQNINRAVVDIAPHLLQEYPDLRIFHISGRSNEDSLNEEYNQTLNTEEQSRVEVISYTTEVYKYSGAADVIVSRAGATNIAEFAQQGKACIIVPSSFLAGGHQLKNAEYLSDKGAAIVLNEEELIEDANRLAKEISNLLSNTSKQESLGENLSEFAKPDAAKIIADIIVKTGKNNENHQT